MRVFPAVDILGGKCVQLVQGKRENVSEYGTPLDNAKRWLDMGADALHVINLDGAFEGSGKNAEVIRSLVLNSDVFIQLGGGIRTLADAGAWLDLGVDRVILGTLALSAPQDVKTLADEYGSDRVVVSVDAKGGQVLIKGWEETAGDYIEWAKRFEELGAGALLFTNVDVEGLQKGIDPKPVKHLVESTKLPVIAAGGISSVSDVAMLKKIGVDSIVLGSALYSGKINLIEALETSK